MFLNRQQLERPHPLQRDQGSQRFRHAFSLEGKLDVPRNEFQEFRFRVREDFDPQNRDISQPKRFRMPPGDDLKRQLHRRPPGDLFPRRFKRQRNRSHDRRFRQSPPPPEILGRAFPDDVFDLPDKLTPHRRLVLSDRRDFRVKQDAGQNRLLVLFVQFIKQRVELKRKVGHRVDRIRSAHRSQQQTQEKPYTPYYLSPLGFQSNVGSQRKPAAANPPAWRTLRPAMEHSLDFLGMGDRFPLNRELFVIGFYSPFWKWQIVMAVERVEWECPGCRRKFAVPDDKPRPKLCPQCQKSAAGPRVPPPLTRAAPEPEMEFADYRMASDPGLPVSAAPSRPVKRRRHEELRTLSLILKIFSALIGLITFVMLAEMGQIVMKTEAGPLRRYVVYNCFGILVGGATVALLVYAFAVLLLVAIDVEYNTRSE